MDLELQGKTVLITGGSKGIGFAAARAFAGEGCSLVLAARSGEALEKAQAALSGFDVRIIAADLSQAGERERLVKEAGPVDILVNNAGAIPGGDILSLPFAELEKAWQLKVFGYIHLTQLVLETMKARRDGTVINIIGDLGRAPRFDYVAGSAANAGLIAFTEAVGSRSTDWNVRVFGINPAGTGTERVEKVARGRAKSIYGDEERWRDVLQNLPFDRLAEPDEVARLIVSLASPALGYISGNVVDFDGGLRNRR
ncbi:short-chain dehydrogenase/reductase [Martelella radicis]|uniref:NAD(P)-dependent dehydrogenase (Short-subunit alcohol dehydrogenase family) n=1 Tax=Martelella radicis TaxID=1397476 RepID=A0A7W6KMP0_9HYPH|nr:short-chain dehydrogenase/reductase [Martelella radicis]MBB4124131.1 NAD(P)-dependent dehydrogenase (short-subunit alcohol dehydrogenase family) [Martelella radicis]